MSGLIMGFAWGIARLGVFGTRVLADNFGMERALGFHLYLPITALVLAFFLPGKNFFLNLQKTLDLGAQNR